MVGSTARYGPFLLRYSPFLAGWLLGIVATLFVRDTGLREALMSLSAIIGGLWAIVLRDWIAVTMIDLQRRLFRLEYGAKEVALSKPVILLVGVFFLVHGIRQLAQAVSGYL